MISKFIDRQREISLLEDEWNKPGGRLIILYGRRRIGKTRLLSEFISGKKGIFYIAEDTSPQIQINGLKEKIAEFTGDSLLKTLETKDWDQLFGYLFCSFEHLPFAFRLDAGTHERNGAILCFPSLRQAKQGYTFRRAFF